MTTKDFYYQVKLKHKDPVHNPFKEGYCNDTWSCPEIRGIVQATSPKEAREKIKEEFENDFNKKNDILLSVIEITPEKKYLYRFFEVKVCEECNREYTEAEFNTVGCYCCYDCKKKAEWKNNQEYRKIYDEAVTCVPVLYRIHNKTNNKNYVGQTIRSFTLRWWEHYHNWIKYEGSDSSCFTFEVLESIENYKDFSSKDLKKLLTEKEQYYIDKYNALTDGYNAVNAKAKVQNVS